MNDVLDNLNGQGYTAIKISLNPTTGKGVALATKSRHYAVFNVTSGGELADKQTFNFKSDSGKIRGDAIGRFAGREHVALNS